MESHTHQQHHTTHQHEHMRHEEAQAHHHDDGMHSGHAELMRNRFWLSLVLTVPVLLYSETIQGWLNFTMPEFPGSEWIPLVFSTIIFIFGGLVFLNMARHELMQRQPGMMTLISIAITTAYTYSAAVQIFGTEGMDFFWELATLIDVMLLGHWIEMRSVGQAQGALEELAKLLPDEAERVNEHGEIEKVSVRDLHVDDVVLIRPGTSIPADGIVVEGSGTVSEAIITGESKPIRKHEGDTLIAGTVNESGSMRIRLEKVGEDTALAGIMRLVNEAQRSKSRAQTMAQQAAFYLTIIAVAAAVITFIGWSILEGNVSSAVRQTVTVLVIACPHALGLAVPLVIAISTTMAARNGVLIRKRLSLEAAHDLDIVVFDKTGTLTRGEQGVVSIAVDRINEAEAVQIAAGVESDSEHPIAQAIRAHAKEQNIAPAAASRFDSMSGRGVKADVDGKTYFLGGPRLLEEHRLTIPQALHTAIDEAESAGQAVIYLADADRILAMFAIADVIRNESKEAIQRLHEMGVKVAMLTGDSEAVAGHVAKTLNIDTYFAGVLPEHKADKIKELQAGGQHVAMVGDGVNDAPALVQADVGIAIGAGTDVAIESAGIILVRNDPRDVVKIIRLSRATRNKTIQNLLWATGYNVVAIPLAMGVLAPVGFILPPAVGAAIMSVSTIIVAVNAMLLRRMDLQAA